MIKTLILSFMFLSQLAFASGELNGTWYGIGIKEYQNIETGDVSTVGCELKLVIQQEANTFGFPLMENKCTDGVLEEGNYAKMFSVRDGQLRLGDQSVGWINETGFRFSLPMGEGPTLSLFEINASLKNGKMSVVYVLTPVPTGNQSRVRQQGDYQLRK